MPTWAWILIGVTLVAVLVLALLSLRMAKRIDRLHRRVEAGRMNLNRRLIKRAAEAMRTADLEQVPEDVKRNLRSTATEALSLSGTGLVTSGLGSDKTDLGGAVKRIQAESNLTRTLRDALTIGLKESVYSDPVARAQLDALYDACYRTTLVRILHNQDVTLTLGLRKRPLVRVLHLAGSAELPHYVDLDDEVS